MQTYSFQRVMIYGQASPQQHMQVCDTFLTPLFIFAHNSWFHMVSLCFSFHLFPTKYILQSLWALHLFGTLQLGRFEIRQGLKRKHPTKKILGYLFLVAKGGTSKQHAKHGVHVSFEKTFSIFLIFLGLAKWHLSCIGTCPPEPGRYDVGGGELATCQYTNRFLPAVFPETQRDAKFEDKSPRTGLAIGIPWMLVSLQRVSLVGFS